MERSEALGKMQFPRNVRGNRGIFQIWVTRACDKACFGCTQGSNLAGKPGVMSPEQYEQAVLSMVTPTSTRYPGVIAMFGGNPCIHPQFEQLCRIARQYIPYKQRGIWTNNLMGKGKIARETFNPAMSNFNVHMDRAAYREFQRDWPEATQLKGLDHDCSHSPPYVAIKDVLKAECYECDGEGWLHDVPGLGTIKCEGCAGTGSVYDEQQGWELISNCDINQRWSAMIGVFRGQLRGWFCEVAGAQSMLHQHEPEYPDTGVPIEPGWWTQHPRLFYQQVDKHCHECGIPLRGKGALAVHGDKEQVSATHMQIYKPKKRGRRVELVTVREQLGSTVPHVTDYLANYKHHKEQEE